MIAEYEIRVDETWRPPQTDGWIYKSLMLPGCSNLSMWTYNNTDANRRQVHSKAIQHNGAIQKWDYENPSQQKVDKIWNCY